MGSIPTIPTISNFPISASPLCFPGKSTCSTENFKLIAEFYFAALDDACQLPALTIEPFGQTIADACDRTARFALFDDFDDGQANADLCAGRERIQWQTFCEKIGAQFAGREVEAFALNVLQDFLRKQADVMLRMRACVAVALHTMIVGQPYRLRHLRRALRHIAGQREGIWLTTAGGIASHIAAFERGD